MKLVTFADANNVERIGVIADNTNCLVDLAGGAALLGEATSDAFRDMLALIDGGDAALDNARTVFGRVLDRGIDPAILPLDKARLLAPVPVPRQMRDALTFEKHYRQARGQRYRTLAAKSPDPAAAWRSYEESGLLRIPQVWYDQPIYYKQNRFSVVGPDAEIVWPRYSQVMDYELELGIFISKRGKNIQRESAGDYIFGYTIFNDFSARDAQALEMAGQLGPAKGKDFDTGNVIGPWLVTADEVSDPYNLTMRARVNGEEWSLGNSGDMHHRFEDIIAHVSADETLYPGEFLGSGTVGNGCGLELNRFLADGDVVELEITGLGVLRNRVRTQR